MYILYDFYVRTNCQIFCPYRHVGFGTAILLRISISSYLVIYLVNLPFLYMSTYLHQLALLGASSWAIFGLVRLEIGDVIGFLVGLTKNIVFLEKHNVFIKYQKNTMFLSGYCKLSVPRFPR